MRRLTALAFLLAATARAAAPEPTPAPAHDAGIPDRPAPLNQKPSGPPLPAPVQLLGHTDTVAALAFSPDGKWLATGSFDRTVRLWSLPAARLVAQNPTKGQVSALAFSPDGKYLVEGDLGFNVTVYTLPAQASPATGNDGGTATAPALPVKQSWVHPDHVASLSVSPDQASIAVGGNGASGTVYNFNTTTPRYQLRARSVIWSKDGKSVLTTTVGEKVALFDAANGKSKKEVLLPKIERVEAPNDFSVVIAYGGRSKEVLVLDPSLTPIANLGGSGIGVVSASISKDGTLLAVTGEDLSVKLWKLGGGKQPELLSSTPIDRLSFLALSPDGHRLALGDGATVKLWELK